MSSALAVAVLEVGDVHWPLGRTGRDRREEKKAGTAGGGRQSPACAGKKIEAAIAESFRNHASFLTFREKNRLSIGFVFPARLARAFPEETRAGF